MAIQNYCKGAQTMISIGTTGDLVPSDTMSFTTYHNFLFHF